MKPFTVTTSIAYPNAAPHVGYALELVQADVLARLARSRGEKVFFLTGVDQHGQKIERAAETAGLDPLTFVEQASAPFCALCALLDISADRFIRTTDADHIAMAQALWSACAASGDIYLRQYQAWYDSKEEAFLGSKEEFPDPSVFGIDPKFVHLIDEENYFFRQSRYKEQIIELLERQTVHIVPESRGRELLNFVRDNDLPDISVSRSVSSLRWGIPVPGDEAHVMYVWFDALTNYLTATASIDGNKIVPGLFWPPSVHVVGKDIQRFHALLWPAMLLSAGLELPKGILVHGFLSLNGKKMSKSIGNVLDPVPLIEKYGSDALRWLLIKEVPTTGDADISERRLAEVYASDLANTFGNLVSRVCTMVHKYAGGRVPERSAAPESLVGEWSAYRSCADAYDLKSAAEVAFSRLEAANRLIEERNPCVMAKDTAQFAELNSLLYGLLEGLRHTVLMIEPIMPKSAGRLTWLVQERSQQWGGLAPGTVLPDASTILFPRLVE